MQLGKRPSKKPSKKKTAGKAPAQAKARIAKSEESVAAEEAVKEFEVLRDEIKEEERVLEDEYPEAFAAIGKIDDLKSQAASAIAKAKGAIAAAKQTIGDFKFVPAFSGPSYLEDKLMEAVCSQSVPVVDADGEPVLDADGEPTYAPDLEAIGTLCFELYQRGVIKAAKVDKKAAKIFHERGGELRDSVEESWDPGGIELAGRVYAPKI